MILIKNLWKIWPIDKEIYNKILIMLSVFAPETTQNIRNKIGNPWNIGDQKRPMVDETKIETQKIKFPIQINGKLRWTINISQWLTEEDIINILKWNWIFDKLIWENNIKKIIFKTDKIINFVI